MKILEKTENGITFKTVYDKGYHYSYGYYSNNTWLDDDRIVLAKSKKLYDMENAKLVVINFADGSETDLKVRVNNYHAYVVNGKKVYYVFKNNLFCLDTESGKKEKLLEYDRLSFPHITNDGKYINFDTSTKDRHSCHVYDVNNRAFYEAFTKDFPPPFNHVTHMMICPTDKDKIFFCHDGDTRYVSNRLWLYEKGKELRCIAKQRLGENGVLADCFGHECWTSDGEGLYFVKYSLSPEGKTGICYVDLKGNQTDVLYGKYHYWHVCVSPCGKYLVSDTNDAVSSVCFINMVTGEEKCLQEVDVTWKHPSHPHPCFSVSSERLCYHGLYENKNCVTAVKIEEVL